MGRWVMLQEKITVSGTTGSATAIMAQEISKFLDCINYEAVIATVKTYDISKTSDDTVDIGLVTLDRPRDDFMNGDAPNGPGWTVKSFEGVAANSYYKHASTLEYASDTVDTKPVDRYLGWAVTVNRTTTGGTFFVTFEIAVTLKRPA